MTNASPRGMWQPAPTSSAMVDRLNFPTIDEVSENILKSTADNNTLRLFLKLKEINTEEKARIAAAAIEEVLTNEKIAEDLPRMIEIGPKENIRGAIVETTSKHVKDLQTKLANLEMVAFVRIMTSQ